MPSGPLSPLCVPALFCSTADHFLHMVGDMAADSFSFTFHGYRTRCYCLSLFECYALQNRTLTGQKGQVAPTLRLIKYGQVA